MESENENNIKDNNISVSIIDYVGKMEDGIGVILSLIIYEIQYELIYWFNKNGKRVLKIEDKFYQHYPQIRDIYEYEYFIDLLYHIDEKLLPPKDEIFEEFDL